MNSNTKAVQYITLISVLVINITSLAKGIDQHETWLIVLGAISLALISAAFIILWVKGKRKDDTTAS